MLFWKGDIGNSKWLSHRDVREVKATEGHREHRDFVGFWLTGVGIWSILDFEVGKYRLGLGQCAKVNVREISMWLPKNERKLLRVYFLKIIHHKDSTKITKEQWYDVADLASVLQSFGLKSAVNRLRYYGEWGDVPTSESGGEADIKQNMKEIRRLIEYIRYVNVANDALENRGLIRMRKHGAVDDVVGISFTGDGWDLGCRYNSWYYKTGGMWWGEYKGHWIWAILAAVFSFIMGLLIG